MLMALYCCQNYMILQLIIHLNLIQLIHHVLSILPQILSYSLHLLFNNLNFTKFLYYPMINHLIFVNPIFFLMLLLLRHIHLSILLVLTDLLWLLPFPFSVIQLLVYKKEFRLLIHIHNFLYFFLIKFLLEIQEQQYLL